MQTHTLFPKLLRILFITSIALLLLSNQTILVAKSFMLPEEDTQIFLIQFSSSTVESELDGLMERIEGEIVAWLPQIRLAKVRVPSHMTMDRIIHQMARVDDTTIQSIEQDGIVFGTQIPFDEFSDPDLLDNEKVYAPQQIQAIDAWSITRGHRDVIIAILDTGLHMEHPEFAGRIVDGYDFVNDDNDPSDDHGHGTYVSGIVGMAADNGHGSVGICPECSIMPVKVLNEKNIGSWFNVSNGIIYAVDNGAQVINVSLGTTMDPNAIKEAVNYATARGTLIIAAVGNNSSNELFYPAALMNVMGVSATDRDNHQWTHSNYGPYVDVSAPGDDIYSTYYKMGEEDDLYDTMSGTSAAAPHVSGLAGLLLSQNRDRTPAELRKLITDSACDLGELGRDPIYGAGLINASAALSLDAGESLDTKIQCPKGQTSGYTLFLPVVMRH